MFVARFFLVAILTLLATNNALSQSISGLWAIDSSQGFTAHSDCSSIVINDSIYVIGGRTFASVGRELPRIQKFYPPSHQWSTVTSKGDTTASGENYAFVSNDSIFVVWVDYGNAVYSYSLLTGVWDSVHAQGDHNTLRFSAASCVFDSKLYVVGGAMDTGEFQTVATMDVFNPSTRTWSFIPPAGHFTPRYGLTACALNGKIYAIGGDTLSPSGGSNNTNIVEVFDPATDSWSEPSVTGIFTPRWYLSSTPLNGKIYCIGGDTGGTVEPVNLVEVFDPATNSWSSAPPMPESDGAFGGRRSRLASAVWNEKIYAVGGYYPHTALNTVEVFTPETNLVNTGPKASAQIALSPNPTTGPITIRGVDDHSSKAVAVAVTNVLGERVAGTGVREPGSGDVELDLSKLPAGTYFVRIQTANGIVMRKVVKE